MKSLAILLFPALAWAAPQAAVTVYTYDSLASKHGFARYVAAELEKEQGIKTELISFSTAQEALTQLKREGVNTKADLLLGFDTLLVGEVAATKAFEPWDQSVLGRIDAEHRFSTNLAVPFDYGYLAFIYDSRRTVGPKGEVSFSAWAKSPELKAKVIIEDAQTSSLGLSLVAWVGALQPAPGIAEFWKVFRPAMRTVAPGWSSAYGAFLKKECDYVLSYTTSPAYHAVEEKVDAFSAVRFSEGHFKQVEGVALVTHSKQKALAKSWVSYLLSDRIQTALPLKQWMYPAVKVTLPPAFQKLPAVKEATKLAEGTWDSKRLEWTKQWNEAFRKAH